MTDDKVILHTLTDRQIFMKWAHESSDWWREWGIKHSKCVTMCRWNSDDLIFVLNVVHAPSKQNYNEELSQARVDVTPE